MFFSSIDTISFVNRLLFRVVGWVGLAGLTVGFHPAPRGNMGEATQARAAELPVVAYVTVALDPGFYVYRRAFPTI